MINYLAANPVKQAAWAAAEGIAPQDVPAYINGLTAVLLRYDTRVTNHGFVNGYANPYETVLQAGTAVLIDQFGVPRARCYCGNPLTPAIPLQGTPTYTGQPWPGYQPTTVVVVQPAPQPITNIIIINVVNNQTFSRPVGGNGSTDTDAPPNALTPGATPSPATSPTPAPSLLPGDRYNLTITGTSAFGQYFDDSGNPATVTEDMCKMVLNAAQSGGETTTAVVVQISGSTIKLFFKGTEMDGTYNPADGSFSATGSVDPTKTGGSVPPGTTDSFVMTGTIGRGTITGTIKETIHEESPLASGGVDGGCNWPVNGTRVS